jgi:hypothetical protein
LTGFGVETGVHDSSGIFEMNESFLVMLSSLKKDSILFLCRVRLSSHVVPAQLVEKPVKKA